MDSSHAATPTSGSPADHRRRAQEQLAELLSLLRRQAAPELVAPLLTLGEQLDRAITSFHMEAIRFRMFTLGRELHREELPLPPESRRLYDAIRASLEAAGFQTRSITT
jgi:hypothetical protein